MLHLSVDNAAFINDAARYLRSRSHILCRLIRIAGEDTPVRIIEIQGRRIAQQVHVRFPQAGNGTDIPPVSFKRIRIQGLAVRQHKRNDIFAKIMGGAGVFPIL
ncbi:hypothetical protein D3C73_1363690 [compost metagenome]